MSVIFEYKRVVMARFLAVAMLSGASALLLPTDLTPALSAAQAAEEKEERETRRTPALSEASFKALSKAQEYIDGNKEENIPPDTDAALAELSKLLERRGLNGYEIASAENMRAYIYFSEEQYQKAITAYETILAQGEDIPVAFELGTLYSLGQLYFVTEDYDRSIQYLNRWFEAAENPNPNAYIFLAQAYYQKEEFARVPPIVEEGMQAARDRDQDINENWWLLQRAAYYEMENYPEVIRILEILVRDFPKKDYYIQLSGLYGNEDMGKKQIATIWAAYIQGMLENEREIMNLTGLLLQEEVPYWSARILDRAIEDEIVEPTAKNLQQLAQAWQLSKETDAAIEVYRLAARKSDEGELFYRLSTLYLDKDMCSEAVDAAQSALDKGSLRSRADVFLVKGMCEFELEEFDAALVSFRDGLRAARQDDDDTAQRQLSQWRDYVRTEKDRVDQIRRSASS